MGRPQPTIIALLVLLTFPVSAAVVNAVGGFSVDTEVVITGITSTRGVLTLDEQPDQSGTEKVKLRAAVNMDSTDTYDLPQDYPSGEGYCLKSTTGGVMNWDECISGGVGTVSLNLAGLQNCTATSALSWTNGADTAPTFAMLNGGITIQWDEGAAGINEDTDTVCGTFTVPDDYGSSGGYVAQISKDAHTTNVETWECRHSIQGAAVSAYESAAISQAAQAEYSVAPAGTYAAGNSVAFECHQSADNSDDTTRLHSLAWEYVK